MIDVDRDRLWSVMKSLDYPRPYGKDGEERALTYLKGTLEDYGYATTIREFPVYKQDLASISVAYHEDFFDPNPYNSELRGTGRNIIAKKNDHDAAKKTIYLTAHYDTIPQSSGILDNATGVSVVLEVARLLHDYHGPFNIAFILFSAEEYGVTGSKAFVAELTDDEKQNTLGAINVDMVGQQDAGDIVMQTVSREHNALTLMVNNHAELPLSIRPGGLSDELSFYMAKIPVITLANGNQDRSRDTQDDQFQYIDLDQLADVTHLVASFLIDLNTSQLTDVLTARRFPSNRLSTGLQDSPWANIMEGLLLEGVYVNLAANGHDGETVYIYKTPAGTQCTVTEKNRQFVAPVVYSDWNQMRGTYDTYYHIVEDPRSAVKAYYAFGACFGEIAGNITSEAALTMMDAIYEMKYKH